MKVKDDGFICGHDYTDETHSRRWGFGVIRAVKEFTRNSKWRITNLKSDNPTSFVLQKKQFVDLILRIRTAQSRVRELISMQMLLEERALKDSLHCKKGVLLRACNF
jgi:hypothetical protein